MLLIILEKLEMLLCTQGLLGAITLYFEFDCGGGICICELMMCWLEKRRVATSYLYTWLSLSLYLSVINFNVVCIQLIWLTTIQMGTRRTIDTFGDDDIAFG